MPSVGVTFALVAIFGSTSWLGTNSVWMELPLLTAGLPEGWSLPSYLATVVQIACIGPLFYGVIHKCFCEIPAGALIVASLLLATSCHVALAFLWQITIGEYSLALYAFVFGLALVNSTSNVLFMPFMAQIIVALWTAFATGCFIVLNRRSHGRETEVKKEKEDVHEGSPLNASKEKIEESTSQVSTHVKGSTYVIILLLTAFVNAQMNGVIPSVSSYAALPTFQLTYHLGLTLSNVISPLASLAPFLGSPKRLSTLIFLSLAATLATAVIVFLAASSPNPPLVGTVWGSVLSITVSIISAGLHSFLRTVFASLLREGAHGSESRLFWCGVFIQIGSFIGSAVMFPLVNFAKIFVSAPACR